MQEILSKVNQINVESILLIPKTCFGIKLAKASQIFFKDHFQTQVNQISSSNKNKQVDHLNDLVKSRYEPLRIEPVVEQ
jgi:hypothetical protein